MGMHKIAATEKESWDMQEKFEGKPNAFIQWKGTDVCMDVTCKCGSSFHADGEFAYFVQCPDCKTIFRCSCFIELIEVLKDPETSVLRPETR